MAALLANDVSADSRPLTITSVTAPSAGSLTFDGATLVYTATHYYDGTATFQYIVADDEGHSQTASVKLDITSIDHAPTANPIVIAGQENIPVTLSLADVLSHVVDADGDPVQLVSITPDSGTQARALVLPGGATQFVPNAYKTGDMTFSYVVTDGYKASTGSIDIDFAKVPQLPIANTDGVYQDNENTPIRLSLASLLANDVDPDGTTLSITDLYRGVNGSVVLDGTDAVFTPRHGYYGTASFNYTLTNAEDQQSEGLVKFLVLPVFHPAIAVSDSGFSMVQDTTLDIDPAQLTANDIDPDGVGVVFLGFTDGPVVKLDNGFYRVTPPFNFSGPLVLTYAITNDSGVVVSTTATIDVQHIEHAPNAIDDQLAGTEDQVLVVQESQILANDYDLDNDAFGLTSIIDASHVSVAFDPGTGQITATPDLHFHGLAYFDYQITDSTGRTGVARANIDVAFVYYPPTIADIAPLSGTEEQPFSITLPGSVVNDIQNYPLLVTLQTPGGGALPSWLHFDRDTLTLSGTPPTGVFGNVALELRADDGQGAAVKDFTLSIAHVNHSPTISAGSIVSGAITEAPGLTGSAVQDQVVGVVDFADLDIADTHAATIMGVTVSGSGNGLPGGSLLLPFLTLGSVTEPAGGQAGQPGLQPWSFSAADGTFDYLAVGETVTLTYTLQLTDEAGATAATSVSVTVTGTNDAPVAAAVSAATRQNDAVTQAFVASDVDESDASTFGVLVGPAVGTAISNGDGTFTFDPGHALDALAAGETQVVTFTYQATDKAGAISDPATVSIVVTGTNDAPVTLLPGSRIVPTGIATALPGIVTTDTDHGAVSTVVLSATYGTLAATVVTGGTIAGGNTQTLTLSGSPAIVTAMLASLTYTSAGSGPDTISVVTSDGIATVANGTIAITAVSPTITSAASVSVTEGTAAAATIYTATATDIAGKTLSYALSGSDAAAFTIDAGTGAVGFKAVPNYQVQSSYHLTLAVADGTLSGSQAVTVTIVDTAPVIAAAATVIVTEGTPATSVLYTASASDVPGTTLSYTLAGKDARLLAINAATGAVSLKAVPSYATQSTYSATIVASDGTLSGAEALTVNVTPVPGTHLQPGA